MMKLAALAIAATTATAAAPAEGSIAGLFEKYISDFNRVYSSAEEKAERFEMFVQNYATVLKLRVEHPENHFGLHPFMDETPEELHTRFSGLNLDMEELKDEIVNAELTGADNFNKQLDYSKCWPSVRDQGHCGSCWTFSTAAAVEGAICKATKEPIEEFLSTQHILDCDRVQLGCSGARSLFQPLKWTVKNGVCLESEYPYKAKKNGFFGIKSCQEKKRCTHKVAVDSVVNLGNNASTADLIEALNKYGPLSVGVGVTRAFMAYAGGVLSAEACGHTQMNHAVTLVGYDTDSTGKVSFKIRNSWSERWGEKGYIRVEEGACGLGAAAIGAVVRI